MVTRNSIVLALNYADGCMYTGRVKEFPDNENAIVRFRYSVAHEVVPKKFCIPLVGASFSFPLETNDTVLVQMKHAQTGNQCWVPGHVAGKPRTACNGCFISSQSYPVQLFFGIRTMYLRRDILRISSKLHAELINYIVNANFDDSVHQEVENSESAEWENMAKLAKRSIVLKMPEGRKKSKRRNATPTKASQRTKMTTSNEKPTNGDMVQSKRKFFSPKQPKKTHLSDFESVGSKIYKSRNSISEKKPFLNGSKKLLQSRLDDTAKSPRIFKNDHGQFNSKHSESNEPANDATSGDIFDDTIEIVEGDEDRRKTSADLVKKPLSLIDLEEKPFADVNRGKKNSEDQKSQLLEWRTRSRLSSKKPKRSLSFSSIDLKEKPLADVSRKNKDSEAQESHHLECKRKNHSRSKESTRSCSSLIEEVQKVRKKNEDDFQCQEETDDGVTGKQISNTSKSNINADKHATDSGLGRYRSGSGLKKASTKKKTEKTISSRMRPRRIVDEKDASEAISSTFIDETNDESSRTSVGIYKPSNAYEEAGKPQNGGVNQSKRDANVITKAMEDETLSGIANMSQVQPDNTHAVLRKEQKVILTDANQRPRLTSSFSEKAGGESQVTVESKVPEVQIASANESSVRHWNKNKVKPESGSRSSIDDGYREYKESESVVSVRDNFAHPVDTISDMKMHCNESPKSSKIDERNTMLKTSTNSLGQVSIDVPPTSSEGRWKSARSETVSTIVDHFEQRDPQISFHFIEQQGIMNNEQRGSSRPQSPDEESEQLRSTAINESISNDKPVHLLQNTSGVASNAHFSNTEKSPPNMGSEVADANSNPSVLTISYEVINARDETQPNATTIGFSEKAGAHFGDNLDKNSIVPPNGVEMKKSPAIARKSFSLAKSDARSTNSEVDDAQGKCAISFKDQITTFQSQAPSAGNEIEQLPSIIIEQGPKNKAVAIDLTMPANSAILSGVDPDKTDRCADSKLFESTEHQLMMEDCTDFDKLYARNGKKLIIREKGSLAFSAEVVKENEPIRISLLHDQQPTILAEVAVAEHQNESIYTNSSAPCKSGEPSRLITSCSAVFSSCSSQLSSEYENTPQTKTHGEQWDFSLITTIKSQNYEQRIKEDRSDVGSLKDISELGGNTLLKLKSETSGKANSNESFDPTTGPSAASNWSVKSREREAKNISMGKHMTLEDSKEKVVQVLQMPKSSFSEHVHQDALASNLGNSVRQLITFAAEVIKRGQGYEQFTYIAMPHTVVTVRITSNCPLAEVARMKICTNERVSAKPIEAVEVGSDSQIVFIQAIQLNNPEWAKPEIHKSEKSSSERKCGSNIFRQDGLKTRKVGNKLSSCSPTSFTGVTSLEQMLETTVLKNN